MLKMGTQPGSSTSPRKGALRHPLWDGYLKHCERALRLYNIISGTAGGRKFQKKKYIEPIETKCLWMDVTHLFEEFFNVLTKKGKLTNSLTNSQINQLTN